MNEETTTTRLDTLESALKHLIENTRSVHSAISDGLNKANGNFDKITTHLGKIDAELKVLSAKIDQLDGSTALGLDNVNVTLEDLKVEVSKINEVTRYTEEYANLKVVK